MLSTHFRALGFNEKEEQIYLALIGKRNVTAALLSKRTNIPRATVYGILEQLTLNGLVKPTKSRGTTTYSITDADAFTRLLDQREQTLREQRSHATVVTEQISILLKSPAADLPEIQVFEGRKAVESMMFEYLPEWRKSMERCSDLTLWGYQDNAVVKTFDKWHRHLWKTMGKDETICLFSNKSDYDKELLLKVRGRQVRALPDGTQFFSSIWLYGEYILMGMTRERPFFAVLIRETMLAANLRAIFKLLWFSQMERAIVNE
jgi:sugar-specific transcriptional regulator TrmB